jgi:hypothetical protein
MKVLFLTTESCAVSHCSEPMPSTRRRNRPACQIGWIDAICWDTVKNRRSVESAAITASASDHHDHDPPSPIPSRASG